MSRTAGTGTRAQRNEFCFATNTQGCLPRTSLFAWGKYHRIMESTVELKSVYIKSLIFVFVLAVLFAEYNSTGIGPASSRGVDEAVDLLSSQILLTRQKAVAGNTRYRIHCDYRAGTSKIYRADPNGRWVLDDPGDDCRFPVDVTVSPDSQPANGYIEIDETGTIVNHTGPVVLKLTDKDGTLKSIRISSSGMVQECSYW